MVAYFSEACAGELLHGLYRTVGSPQSATLLGLQNLQPELANSPCPAEGLSGTVVIN